MSTTPAKKLAKVQNFGEFINELFYKMLEEKSERWGLQKLSFLQRYYGCNISVTVLNSIVGFLNRVQAQSIAQRLLILYFCFFFKDNKAHNVHKTYIIKIQSRNLINDNRMLAVPNMSFQMIPKNKNP